MAVNFKKKEPKAPKAPKWTELEQEGYFLSLLTRAKNVIEVEGFKAERMFFGFSDGLLKGGGLNTRDLRVNRQIRNLVALVKRAIETGKLDPTLEKLFNENEL